MVLGRHGLRRDASYGVDAAETQEAGALLGRVLSAVQAARGG